MHMLVVAVMEGKTLGDISSGRLVRIIIGELDTNMNEYSNIRSIHNLDGGVSFKHIVLTGTKCCMRYWVFR